MTPLDAQAIQQAIKAKIIELVAPMGEDASDLEPDDIIPATGLIDSAALLELIAWYENHFKVPLKPEEVTIDNLGSLSAMAAFVIARRKG
jgi:D-alanine--poly(phosphoribitol) ligase subunit 2